MIKDGLIISRDVYNFDYIIFFFGSVFDRNISLSISFARGGEGRKGEGGLWVISQVIKGVANHLQVCYASEVVSRQLTRDKAMLQKIRPWRCKGFSLMKAHI